MSSKTAGKGRDVKDRSKYVHQNNKLDWTFGIRELPWTEKQQQLLKLLQDKATKCVFITGPAGSSKTLVSVYSALKALNERKVSDIVYIRSAVESASQSLGFLPGDADDKMGPYAVPFMEKLEELLDSNAVTKLTQDGRLKTYAINYLRGLHMSVKYIIVDEAQSVTLKDLVTIVTRMGEHSKLVICGDLKQSDLKNGNRHDFEKFSRMFNDQDSQDAGIFQFEFTKEDIVRSEFVKFVVGKLEQHGYGDIA